MSLIADDAAVLMRYDYSETSQVLALLTRNHGKVRAIAKGIKRGTKTRFAAGVDLLDVGTLVISSGRQRDGGLATLTEWKQTRAFSGLRETLPRIHAAEYVAEITGRLTEDWDPHPDLFGAFVDLLAKLSAADDVLPAVVRYQGKLLTSIGSLPRFDVCVECGRSDDLTHFSSFEGGMICRHCEPARIEKREVSRKTLLTIRAVVPAAAGPRSTADTFTMPQAFRLLDYHMVHLAGSESKLAAQLAPSRSGGTAR